MPKNVAQFTGMVVTTIIVMGSDIDVFYALPLGIFAMAISTAVFPSLAEHGARNQVEQIRATVVGALRFILYLTIPASVGLVLLSEPVVRVPA